MAKPLRLLAIGAVFTAFWVMAYHRGKYAGFHEAYSIAKPQIEALQELRHSTVSDLVLESGGHPIISFDDQNHAVLLTEYAVSQGWDCHQPHQ